MSKPPKGRWVWRRKHPGDAYASREWETAEQERLRNENAELMAEIRLREILRAARADERARLRKAGRLR